MKKFQFYNNLTGWLVFAIATIVYLLTLEPTASWWDCGEYIATAYKLQVGHPPGAPLFQLLGRFFSLFAFGNTANVAMMINTMSALSSSFTILFLFWIITIFGRKIVLTHEGTLDIQNQRLIIFSGVIGALAYTFSDSFWFSAVEGEVYAMSSFFTALTFWAILKWEAAVDERYSNRWIIFIAYLVGLTIGVHLLNLLAIPAIGYVIYYKKYKNFSWKGFIITGILSVLSLAFIMYVIIPGTVKLAGNFELFFVNTIGLPFNSGTVVFFAVLIGLLVFGIQYTIKKKMVLLNIIVLSFTFILIGYSSFFILIIRANANTPINENNPSDAISLLSYLNREQYGDWPLLKGQYYNSPVKEYGDRSPVYIKDKKKGKYVITDHRINTVPVYEDNFTTIFPRMWSNQKTQHQRDYKNWADIKGVPVRHTKPDGTTETIMKPTFGENLKFFFKYQIGHMYLRYFMWNFSGRQNDVEGHGGIRDGNWITGINFLDSPRLGNQSDLPRSMQNSANNKFYLLPLILGLIGLFFQINHSKRDAWVVGLLFLMTGLAIVVYLNQTPHQPRERDYAFAGSFMAYSIWIGLGVMAIAKQLGKFIGLKSASIVSFLVALILVPGLMANEGWDDHDRSGKTAARDYAKNYLMSCAPNAIVFTNGDNDTFPLWYAQEVEGVRPDVRVVNYMLSGGAWYVHQLQRKVYDSDRLPLQLAPEQYNKGVNDVVPVMDMNSRGVYIPVKEAVNFIANDENKRTFGTGEKLAFLPVRKLSIPVDKDKVLQNGTVPADKADQIVDAIDFDVSKSLLYKNDLMLLDLIANNNWERPIYFANPSSVSDVLNVDEYCHLEGFVYRLRPFKADHYVKQLGGIEADTSFKALTENCAWGNLEKEDVTVDRESMRNSIIPKQNFMRLAEALIKEGKKDKAKVVLDTCIYYFPDSKFPFDYFMTSVADMYYHVNDTTNGDYMSETIFNNYKDDMRYYHSLRPELFDLYFQDVQKALGAIQNLSQITQRNKRTKLSDEMSAYLDEEIQRLSLMERIQ